MTKLSIARARLQEIIPGDRRDWTLPDLLWEVNYALELDEMVSLSTLRRAVTALPEGCVQRGKRLVIHARHFAPPAEIVATLKALDLYDEFVPVLIERHQDTIRQRLMLADDAALYQSMEWAAHGNFEIYYYWYGKAIRWIPAKKVGAA